MFEVTTSAPQRIQWCRQFRLFRFLSIDVYFFAGIQNSCGIRVPLFEVLFFSFLAASSLLHPCGGVLVCVVSAVAVLLLLLLVQPVRIRYLTRSSHPEVFWDELKGEKQFHSTEGCKNVFKNFIQKIPTETTLFYRI